MPRIEQAYWLTRRRFIQGTTAGVLSCAVGPALAGTSLRVPQVDSVSIHTIVDNATFGPFLPGLQLPGLQVRHLARGPDVRPTTRKALMAEFGLSLLCESREGSKTRRLLVDLGLTAEALRANLALLGVDPKRIDAVVLSHGHADHYGGFPGLFSDSPDKGRKVPLFVGGEETFCERLAPGNPPSIMGTLDRNELGSAGFDVVIAPEPRVVADQAFTTGTIPLRTVERAAIPTHMRPGVGCSPARLPADKRDVAQLPDDGEHELATCYAVKDHGLVVIASCSHRGVVNSIRQAQAISGIEKVHAVVGGFHLVRPRTEDEARWTVAELSRLNPTYLVPMHCSGDVFMSEASRLMPEKVIKPYVGTKFTFGSI